MNPRRPLLSTANGPGRRALGSPFMLQPSANKLTMPATIYIGQPTVMNVVRSSGTPVENVTSCRANSDHNLMVAFAGIGQVFGFTGGSQGIGSRVCSATTFWDPFS
jgi:hypothetical protein